MICGKNIIGSYRLLCNAVDLPHGIADFLHKSFLHGAYCTAQTGCSQQSIELIDLLKSIGIQRRGVFTAANTRHIGHTLAHQPSQKGLLLLWRGPFQRGANDRFFQCLLQIIRMGSGDVCNPQCKGILYICNHGGKQLLINLLAVLFVDNPRQIFRRMANGVGVPDIKYIFQAAVFAFGVQQSNAFGSGADPVQGFTVPVGFIRTGAAAGPLGVD